MLSSLRYRLKRMFNHIWVPIGCYAVLGLLAAVVAVRLRAYIPSSWAFKIGADAIDSLLNILASSMLAVTTFSLSIMLAAFAAASSTATPRAFQLLKTDRTAQQVLASFIGAFIFSLVGIISLKIGIYGEGGRVILFAATILVLILIVFNLVRWIGHLTDFGRLGDTMARVEDAAADAMTRRLKTPWLGANPMHRAHPPDAAVPIRSDKVGHIQFINLQSLNDLAEEAGCTIYIAVTPGNFVYRGSDLAHILNGPTGEAYDTLLQQVGNCFDIGMTRSFDQDPRFGMITLSEIASRALSPAVNDPGTAIDVIRRMTRVLSLWNETSEVDVIFPRLYVHGLQSEDMLRDAFSAMSRDGAALYEVHVALQNALLALVRLDPRIFAAGAVGESRRAMTYACEAMIFDADLSHLQRIADRVAEVAQIPAADSQVTRT
ncbi:Uncharacterized membrane protein [Loktanella atrilutea]|uniref:Uncharacterized membrane protein n=1 Tax=Loktanella atrilutea TaxID=366533 RepID=A0A1M4TMX0_LOKAT|nr:DUF2254 domain-containing protein [Loktanella atrilutea]SHE45811.1 Uncharacterized membrane protein [Loktanella atrilutea]